MQEHPVPQNVTGYEFHLIGQMTLKQFMEVAAGVVVAVLIYWTNLPVAIKYLLMAISGLLGVALAFVPLEGRPLDRWFFAFIKSIYQPTMFFWKKTDTTPEVFTYTAPSNIDRTPKVDYAPMRQARLQEYVHTVKVQENVPDEESKAADELLKLFSETTPAVGRITELNITPSSNSTSPKTEAPAPSILPTPTKTIAPTDSLIQVNTKDGVTPELIATTAPAPSTKMMSPLVDVVSPAQKQNTDTVRQTEPLKDFPFPNKPTAANMLSGMVVSPDNKIVEGAILTITRQSDNTPVRAIKTNTLGQFAIVTPLEKGTYIILTERDGLRFDKYSLVLNNQVVEPIIIRALK